MRHVCRYHYPAPKPRVLLQHKHYVIGILIIFSNNEPPSVAAAPMSLQDQIANAKLKVCEKYYKTLTISSQAPETSYGLDQFFLQSPINPKLLNSYFPQKSATGGGDAAAARPAPKPALSLQDEMRLKLERRKAKA